MPRGKYRSLFDGYQSSVGVAQNASTAPAMTLHILIELKIWLVREQRQPFRGILVLPYRIFIGAQAG